MSGVKNQYRITAVGKQLVELGLEAFITSNSANVQYLSGFTGSAGTVVLGANGEAILITDSRYTEQAQSQCPGFEIILGGGPNTLKAQFEKIGAKRVGFEPNHTNVASFERMKAALPEIEFVSAYSIVENVRIIKSEEEIEYIRQAQRVMDRVFPKLLELVKPGITEFELATEFMYQVNKAGAQNGLPVPIVASGWRSSLPHGTASDKKVEYGDFITFDLVVAVKNYKTDMTRTVVVGKADEKQKAVYETVLKAQREGIASMVVGASGVHPDKVARDVINATEFKDFCFQYGVGHGVGLDVHERPFMGPYCPDTLAEGMVITMEPGIYIPGWGGVRIEDVVVVTEKGPEVLSTLATELLIL
ncbi:MAG: aminopeptidase P family protein [Firmicutes bacterium]|nr:aminopeptidase P family protein [Bacillota bacterium]